MFFQQPQHKMIGTLQDNGGLESNTKRASSHSYAFETGYVFF